MLSEVKSKWSDVQNLQSVELSKTERIVPTNSKLPYSEFFKLDQDKKNKKTGNSEKIII